MANYQVQANQLTEGKLVLVNGTLSYSRLTRLIDGPALVAANQRKVQVGASPVDKPHTTATVTGAQVVAQDPQNPSLEEVFVAERCYGSKTNPSAPLAYSIDSKGSLPIIAVRNENGLVEQDESGRELDSGLNVTLVLRVYKPKGYANRGLSLDQVIVNEPVRYYNAGGVDTEQLAAHGIVFATPPRPVQVPEATQAQAQAAPVAADPGTMITPDGYAMPAPAAQPVPQQFATPATPVVPAAVAAPAVAQQAFAPAAPAAPVQATPTAPVPPVAPAAAQPAPGQQLVGAAPVGSAVGGPVDPASPWNPAPAGAITFEG